MALRVLLAAMALSACSSSPPPYTWGDASQAVSEAVCAAWGRCAQFKADAPWIGQCSRHTAFHMCELGDTCDAVLPDIAPAIVETCVGDLAMVGTPHSDACYMLQAYGIPPHSCVEMSEQLDPSRQADR